jgi:hypothetical protein
MITDSLVQNFIARVTQLFFPELCVQFDDVCICYPLANEVMKGYSNATFRP